MLDKSRYSRKKTFQNRVVKLICQFVEYIIISLYLTSQHFFHPITELLNRIGVGKYTDSHVIISSIIVVISMSSYIIEYKWTW